MINIRPSKERGFQDKGWLQSYHTFSFDKYYDPEFLGWRSIRVINEDTISGRKGFGLHAHQEMEIVTYVIEGTLEHKDNLGHTLLLSEGECGRMSAGTGITHSEYNLSSQLPVHFLQIWILPNLSDLKPSYLKKRFSSASKWGQWCLILSNNGREGSLLIHQDIDVYSTYLEGGEEIVYEGSFERYYWIQVISGSFLVQNVKIEKGDGLSITQEDLIKIQSLQEGELLLFDCS